MTEVLDFTTNATLPIPIYPWTRAEGLRFLARKAWEKNFYIKDPSDGRSRGVTRPGVDATQLSVEEYNQLVNLFGGYMFEHTSGRVGITWRIEDKGALDVLIDWIELRVPEYKRGVAIKLLNDFHYSS